MRDDWRSREEYFEELEAWERDTRLAWPEVVDHILGAVGQASCLRVRNLGDMFVEDVAVEVHIEGPVEAINAVNGNSFDLADHFPPPPVKFGPRMMDIYIPQRAFSPGISLPTYTRPKGVSFKNGGSTTLSLELGQLRPRATRDSDPDEFVLVVRDVDSAVTELRGQWEITARGHHRVYRGELSVPVKTDFSINTKGVLDDLLAMDSDRDA
jgi:hypothetical protein